MDVEAKKTLENTPNQDNTDVSRLKESLKNLWEKKEATEDTEKEIEKIIKELVFASISPSEILKLIPFSKTLQAREIIDKYIVDYISTLDSEKYKQYLQAQFPQGVPENAWDMALSLVADTSEMYKNVKQEIGKTGIDTSEHDQAIRKKEQRIAMEATQKSETATTKLSEDLSHIH